MRVFNTLKEIRFYSTNAAHLCRVDGISRLFSRKKCIFVEQKYLYDDLLGETKTASTLATQDQNFESGPVLQGYRP